MGICCSSSSDMSKRFDPGRKLLRRIMRIQSRDIKAAEDKNIDVKTKYEIKEKLGSGATCSVYACINKETKEKFALKRVLKAGQDESAWNSLLEEVEILRGLSHPKIIKLVETFYNDDGIDIVLEFCGGGELYEALANAKNFKYTEGRCVSLVKQMLLALVYLHSSGIVHRDLKLANFVFTNDKTWDLKLIDFGLSKKYVTVNHSKKEGFSVRRLTSFVGTCYYVAPEIVNRNRTSKGYTDKVDMWSIGVITYMLLTGKPAFDAMNFSDLKSAIKRGVDYKSSNISEQGIDFIKKCLTVNPDKRTSAAQALIHPWISDESAANDRPIDQDVLSTLKDFTKFSKFRRLTMLVVASRSPLASRLSDLFIEMDKDGTGRISKDELKQILFNGNSTLKFSESDVDEIFTSLDQDETGRVNFSQFTAAAFSKRGYLTKERLRDVFAVLDKNNSGRLNLSDLSETFEELVSADEIDKMLKQVDTAGDGSISFDEFMQEMTRNDSDNAGDKKSEIRNVEKPQNVEEQKH
eukprot:g2881.t1